jgi:hypothetical protein
MVRPKKVIVGNPKYYSVTFRKRSGNELKTGTIKIYGALKHTVETFNNYGWGLIKVKEVRGRYARDAK